MYTCRISECGLSYQAEDIKTIVEKLHEYFKECYGVYIIRDGFKGKVLKTALEIKLPGEYFIKAGNKNKELIYCEIRES